MTPGRLWFAWATLAAAGCAAGRGRAAAPPAAVAPPPVAVVPAPDSTTAIVKTDPVLPPQLAFLAGLMPLRSLGADTFRTQRPTFDGRGVLIAILDGGIDPGVPGLRTTSTGLPKLADLRDFSGEGRIDLVPLVVGPDGTVSIGAMRMGGLGRVARLAAPPYYGGVFRELPLGPRPASDVDGNGRNTDEFPVIVARSSSGWFVMTDTDRDGSFEDEAPVYDYAVAGTTFSYASGAARGAGTVLTIAVNLGEADGRPVLDLVFDNAGHGTHVAGIAAGHDMFGVNGFDGVAPGAQLLGIKIANNARGGMSVTGSVLRGMNYAADYAQRRNLPLVLNLSYGVGNESEGSAAIDSLVDEFVLKHPGVLFVISAGNDGPGLSTVGFPGSAELALTACALFPGVFAKAPDEADPPPPDMIGWWSARGGEVAKPDVCAPGVAFSNVPAWHTGEEISAGTSMAAPAVSGAAALLQSALIQQNGRAARAVELKRALVASARPVPGGSPVDQGAGIPNVSAAFRWLQAGHQTGVYLIRSLPDGGNSSVGPGAYRRNGLAGPADTIQRFDVRSVDGQPAARLMLNSDAPWLAVAPVIDLKGGPEIITAAYRPGLLTRPGLYVGTVWARSATDTLGGPLFALVNTVVVPATLAEPFHARAKLPAGGLARHFFDIPAGAGGITIRASAPGLKEKVTVYLFEPDGKPSRGGAQVSLGGKDSARATLQVNADDLVPGVYEVVVTASPTGTAVVDLDVAMPAVALAARTPGAPATLRNEGEVAQAAGVRAELAGAVRDTGVIGRGSQPVVLVVRPPAWAARMVVDVQLPRDVWNEVTDFGVTVFDSAGQQIGQGPMNYALSRQIVRIDSTRRGRRLSLELYPAFAHLRAPDTWAAGVRISYVADRAVQAPGLTALTVPGASEASIDLPAAPAGLDMPDGFRPLLRLTAEPASGPPSVRQGAW